jgi:L-lactate dehydrogenase (cytochrome)
MKPREVLELVRLRPPELNRQKRVIARSPDVASLRREAKRFLPRAVFDYVDGGAEEEVTMAANRAAFNSYEFHPRVLVDVAKIDLTTELFGKTLSMPLGLCPTGYTRMMYPPGGEMSVARVARARRIPYGLSTVGTTTPEDIGSVGHNQWWYQLYELVERSHGREMLARAEAAGAAAVEITVDTPVPGFRIRDARNGLTIPPQLSMRTVADIGVHVGYWVSALRNPPFRFVNAPAHLPTVPEIVALYDAALTFEYLAEIRALWPRTLIVKGPVGPDDARRAVEAGADAIHLSNHGGRQLDRCVPPLEQIRPVREAVGEDVPIIVDSGIRNGGDMAIALALGADLCMIGRPYLYGLAAAGEAGADHVVELFARDLKRTMQLLGVTSIPELRKNGDELISRVSRA